MKDKQNQFNAQQQHSHTNSSQPTRALLENNEQLPSLLKDRQTHRKKSFNGSIHLPILVEERSHFLLSLLGYGLLAFALVACLHIIIPLRFTNPAWELQTIGLLVEHAALLLIGLMLVFYRYEGHIKELEKSFLGFLSWVSLLLGILYLLMIPLGVADTWRIYYGINAQITTQFSQQSQQLQAVKDQLKQANTDQQLKKLIVSPAPQGNSQNLQTLKKQFLAQLPQAERTSKDQADSTRTSQEQLLLKNSVKWHLGALVVGTLLILFWHLTDWARTP